MVKCHSRQIIEHIKDYDIIMQMKIQVLTWDRHKDVEGLNQ